MIGLLSGLLSIDRFAMAGTTQIFSPAGLPRAVSKDYSVPNGISTPQTFATPPIPLTDTGMQSFSTIPLKDEISPGTAKTNTAANGGKEPVDITSNKPANKVSNDNASVDSLFQLPSSPGVGGSSSVKQERSIVGAGGKAIWHVLDNLGVPMFLGKDSDLDPSLSSAHIVTPKNYCCEPQNMDKSINLHNKIPQSELEGIDVQSKNDAKSP